eukprot:9239924-Ditylum_brightwellii.AAC.1
MAVIGQGGGIHHRSIPTTPIYTAILPILPPMPLTFQMKMLTTRNLHIHMLPSACHSHPWYPMSWAIACP